MSSFWDNNKEGILKGAKVAGSYGWKGAKVVGKAGYTAAKNQRELNKKKGSSNGTGYESDESTARSYVSLPPPKDVSSFPPPPLKPGQKQYTSVKHTQGSTSSLPAEPVVLETAPPVVSSVTTSVTPSLHQPAPTEITLTSPYYQAQPEQPAPPALAPRNYTYNAPVPDLQTGPSPPASITPQTSQHPPAPPPRYSRPSSVEPSITSPPVEPAEEVEEKEKKAAIVGVYNPQVDVKFAPPPKHQDLLVKASDKSKPALSKNVCSTSTTSSVSSSASSKPPPTPLRVNTTFLPPPKPTNPLATHSPSTLKSSSHKSPPPPSRPSAITPSISATSINANNGDVATRTPPPPPPARPSQTFLPPPKPTDPKLLNTAKEKAAEKLNKVPSYSSHHSSTPVPPPPPIRPSRSSQQTESSSPPPPYEVEVQHPEPVAVNKPTPIPIQDLIPPPRRVNPQPTQELFNSVPESDTSKSKKLPPQIKPKPANLAVPAKQAPPPIKSKPASLQLNSSNTISDKVISPQVTLNEQLSERLGSLHKASARRESKTIDMIDNTNDDDDEDDNNPFSRYLKQAVPKEQDRFRKM